MINYNFILCFIAATYSAYVLYRYLHITSEHKETYYKDAVPVVLGFIAWITAAIQFLIIDVTTSPIIIQRVMMVLAWCWVLNNMYKIGLIKSK